MKSPFECLVFQTFGENFNNSYQQMGLLGHPAFDESCGYGSDIHSYVSGLVYSLYRPEKPAPDGYTAVYILVETELEVFEFSVGHVSEIEVHSGDQVVPGQVIAKEGNRGLVFSGTTQITVEMQKAGDHRGSHRHVQKRPLRRVKRTTPGRPFIMGENRDGNFYVYTDKDNNYLEYALPANGYAGCVDWARPLFDRDLCYGSRGYDVELLQRALKMPVDLQTGYFGSLTLKAVQDFQNQNGISPVFGYVGPKTRAMLNARYSQLA